MTDLPSAPGALATEEDPSLLRAANVVLSRRIWLLAIPTTLGLLVAVPKLVSDPTYTSHGSFLPRAAESPTGGALGGVAMQLGIALPTAGTLSPQFYAELLRSPRVLRALAESTFVADPTGARRTLADLFDIRQGSPGVVRERVVKELKLAIQSAADLKTGVITYSVRSPSPVLSQQIGLALVAQINAYNLESRRSSAAAERQFMEERMASALQDLRSAETQLGSFMARNRVILDPTLVLEQQRLTREQRIREQVYTSVAQMLEQASIHASRATPTISSVELPMVPPERDRRGLVSGVAAGVAGGIILALVLIFLAEYFASAGRRQPDEMTEFVTLWEQTLVDLRRPFATLRGSRKRGATPPTS